MQTLLHFTATWAERICGPNRDEVAAAATALGWRVREVDIDAEPDMARAYVVLNVPASPSKVRRLRRSLALGWRTRLRNTSARASRAVLSRQAHRHYPRFVTEPDAPEREYVGYVWWGETWHDWAHGERIEVLLYAASSTEAGAHRQVVLRCQRPLVPLE